MTSALKALAFVALAIAAFVVSGGPASARTRLARRRPGWRSLAAFVLSLQAVIYTYDGWSATIYFCEEVENPGRDIPRSLIGGVLSVIAIYLLVNLALLVVLPVATLAGQAFAAGTVAGVIFGAWGDPVFRTLTIVSMLSAINSNHLMASRVLFAMSRDGLVTRHRRPSSTRAARRRWRCWRAPLVAVSSSLFGRTFERVITVLAFFFVANYTLSFISVFVLRRREPEKAAAVPRVGLPVDDGARAGGVDRVPGRGDRERPGQQPDRAGSCSSRAIRRFVR